MTDTPCGATMRTVRPRAAPAIGVAGILAVLIAAASSARAQVAAPLAPTCGSEIASAQVTLVIDNAAGPGAPFTYDVELYGDQGLTTLLTRRTDLAQGAGATTAWAVPVALQEGRRHAWRVRAKTPTTDGPWSVACTFVIDAIAEPPPVLAHVSPPDGAHVATTQPTLRVDNASDPDQDVLRYQFEVYADPALSFRVAASPAAGVAEGAAGTTSWQVVGANPALTEGHRYYWRARAVDPGGLTSPWSGATMFIIDAVNEPPPPPTLLSPRDGEVAVGLHPAFTLVLADDPDDEPLAYDWQVGLEPTFATIVDGGDAVTSLGPSITSFASTLALDEDRGYCWRARADDGEATSAWAVACFSASSRNDPPTAPVLLAPTPLAIVTTDRPQLAWTPAVDPEHDAITYQLDLADVGGAALASLTGLVGTVAPLPIPVVDGASYRWQVRAVDRLGAVGPPSATGSFTVDLGRDADPVADGGGCQAAGATHRGGLGAVGLGVLVLVIGFGARRRRPRAAIVVVGAVLVGLVAVSAGPRGAAADAWRVDASVAVGQPLGAAPSERWGDGQAGSRVALGVELTRSTRRPWLVGVDLSGSFEHWDGGVGCGEIDFDGAVIAVGIMCMLPTLAVHGLAGVEVAPVRGTALRLGAGVGATALFVMTDLTDHVATHVSPSAIAKVEALGRVGDGWWLGLVAEGRALAGDAAPTAASAGVVVGWRR